MERKTEKKRKGKREGSYRLDKASKDYKRLMEEIAPFIKKRVTVTHTTEGQWRDSNCLSFDKEG